MNAYQTCTQCGHRYPEIMFFKKTTDTYNLEGPFEQCYNCRMTKLLSKKEQLEGVTTKICGACKQELPIESFNRRGLRRSFYCKSCRKDRRAEGKDRRKEALKAYYQRTKDHERAKKLLRHSLDPRWEMLNNAKSRAKRKGLEYSLDIQDIVMPKECPVLKIPLIVSEGFGKENSPTLDRIDNTKGYIPGNVLVVSHKANAIKSNATVAELQKVASFYGGLKPT